MLSQRRNGNMYGAVQTPQVFEKTLIFEAYARLMEEECVHVTDDAIVVRADDASSCETL